MNNKKTEIFDIINNTILFFVIMTIIFPMLHIFSMSLSDSVYVLQNKVSFYPREIDFTSFKLIFSSSKIPNAYLNSIKYTILGTAINFALTAIFAYPLSKTRMVGNKVMTIMVVGSMLFSAGIIPMYLVVGSLGMINKIWAMILPNAINSFYLLIVRTNYMSIPSELEESVEMDGGSDFTKLFKIVIPLSKPTLAAIVLFYIVMHWNSYFTALIYLNDSEKWPVTMILREMIILQNLETEDMTAALYADSTPQGLKYAAIVVTILPMLVVYPFIQKYFVKGLMIGGVKG